jgi:hypothetical protein
MFGLFKTTPRRIDQIRLDIIETGSELHGVTPEHIKALDKMTRLMRELKSIGGGDLVYSDPLPLGTISIKYCTFIYSPFEDQNDD